MTSYLVEAATWTCSARRRRADMEARRRGGRLLIWVHPETHEGPATKGRRRRTDERVRSAVWRGAQGGCFTTMPTLVQRSESVQAPAPVHRKLCRGESAYDTGVPPRPTQESLMG